MGRYSELDLSQAKGKIELNMIEQKLPLINYLIAEGEVHEGQNIGHLFFGWFPPKSDGMKIFYTSDAALIALFRSHFDALHSSAFKRVTLAGTDGTSRVPGFSDLDSASGDWLVISVEVGSKQGHRVHEGVYGRLSIDRHDNQVRLLANIFSVEGKEMPIKIRSSSTHLSNGKLFYAYSRNAEGEMSYGNAMINFNSDDGQSGKGFYIREDADRMRLLYLVRYPSGASDHSEIVKDRLQDIKNRVLQEKSRRKEGSAFY